jgi:hypothetical protein
MARLAVMADAATIGRVLLAGRARLLSFGQTDGRKIYPRGSMDWAPRLARAKTDLRNIPGSKRGR